MIFPGAKSSRRSASIGTIARSHQEGSHIILQTDTPSHQRIPVPDHNPVRIGTLNSILRLVAMHKGVKKQDVLASF